MLRVGVPNVTILLLKCKENLSSLTPYVSL